MAYIANKAEFKSSNSDSQIKPSTAEGRFSTTRLVIPDEVEYLNLKFEQKYWRRNIKWTLCPLLLCGIPVYLFFISDKHWTKGGSRKRRPTSILTWLSFIRSASWHNPILAFFNLLYLLGAIFINGALVWSLYPSFYALLVLGEFKRTVFSAILFSIRKILILVAVDAVWMYGYRIRIFLSDLISYEPLGQLPFKALPYARLRLGAFFVFILATHALHSFMYFAHRFPGKPVEAYFVFDWLLYAIDPLLASFCFPIYAALAWTLHRNTLLLRLYLRTTNSSPEFVIPSFKESFKVVSNGFQGLTAMIGLYFSWAIVVFIASISGDISDFAYLVKNTGEDAVQVEASIFLIEWSPRRVRAFVLLLLSISLKIGLVVYVVRVARTSNIEAKYIVIALNDFIAGPSGQNLSVETYQAFRLLKYYVESRLAAEARASLLRIPVTSFIGGMSCSQLNTLLIAITLFSFITTYMMGAGTSSGGFWGIFNTPF